VQPQPQRAEILTTIQKTVTYRNIASSLMLFMGQQLENLRRSWQIHISGNTQCDAHFRDLDIVVFSLNTRFISGQHGTQGYQVAATFPSGPRTILTQPATLSTFKVCRFHYCFHNAAFACGDCWCRDGSEGCNRQVLKPFRPTSWFKDTNASKFMLTEVVVTYLIFFNTRFPFIEMCISTNKY
jgi:hypothetical protein